MKLKEKWVYNFKRFNVIIFINLIVYNIKSIIFYKLKIKFKSKYNKVPLLKDFKKDLKKELKIINNFIIVLYKD